MEQHLEDEAQSGPPVLRRLAAVVKSRRKAKRWSQQNLAEATNLSRDAIKRIEAGQEAKASVALQVLLALECTTQDLKRLLYGQIGARRVSE